MRAAWLAAGMLVAAAAAAQDCPSVRYEPEAVTLQGTVSISTGEHPNGARWERPILLLEKPITVEPSAQSDAVNVREACVTEVQLYSPSATIHAQLLKAAKAAVRVEGMLFHEHTAWHVRPVLMAVKSLQMTQDRRAK